MIDERIVYALGATWFGIGIAAGASQSWPLAVLWGAMGGGGAVYFWADAKLEDAQDEIARLRFQLDEREPVEP